MESTRRTLTVEKLASGGDGIAFTEGRAVFIPCSIPGEIVECGITERRKDFDRAEVLRIVEPSPWRAEPPCQHFGECGGCSLQHIHYPSQLHFKTEIMRDAFARIAKLDPGNIISHPSQPYGYRNRIQLHFSHDHGLGFNRLDSDETLRIRSCPIAVKVIGDWLKTANRSAKVDKALKPLIGERERFQVFGQDQRLYIEGRDAEAQAAVAGKTYVFPLRHFFQSNLDAASRLAEDLTRGISGRNAADLYCGAGLFAARLAERFDHVACVESDPVSLEAARRNVARGRASFHAVDVDTWAASARARKETRSYDWIVADPPRGGLSPAIIEWIADSGAQALSYVSCDHVTLARDAAALKRKGMSLTSLDLYDFYPQTARIEALAQFARSS